ncbi:MAG: hypothetical protein ABIF92_02615 [archaeon]
MVAPILIAMSLVDMIGAFVLLTLPSRVNVAIFSMPLPVGIAFYFGVMMLIKGLYSLFWGIIGADA